MPVYDLNFKFKKREKSARPVAGTPVKQAMNFYMKPDRNILLSPPACLAVASLSSVVCYGGRVGVNGPALRSLGEGMSTHPALNLFIQPTRGYSRVLALNRKEKTVRFKPNKPVNHWENPQKRLKKHLKNMPIPRTNQACQIARSYGLLTTDSGLAAGSNTHFSPKPLFVSPCAPTALKMNYSKLKAKKSPFFTGHFTAKSLGNQAKTFKKVSPKCRNFRGNPGRFSGTEIVNPASPAPHLNLLAARKSYTLAVWNF
jgi:hypothetical protein